MRSLQEAILNLAIQVQHKIKAFYSMISANINSASYPRGLLTSPQGQYEECMIINAEKLKYLLERDLNIWHENAMSKT